MMEQSSHFVIALGGPEAILTGQVWEVWILAALGAVMAVWGMWPTGRTRRGLRPTDLSRPMASASAGAATMRHWRTGSAQSSDGRKERRSASMADINQSGGR